MIQTYPVFAANDMLSFWPWKNKNKIETPTENQKPDTPGEDSLWDNINTNSTQNLQAEKTEKATSDIKIQSVEIVGNNLVSTDEIMQNINITTGTPYSVETVQQNLKSIYEMGYFNEKMKAIPIKIDDKEITSLEVDERSKEGIFLAFQNPSEIPGVVAADFYKAAMNVRRDKKLKLFEFYRSLEGASKEVNLPFDMVNRHLNDGFSGGEKKRNEIFQMILLNPTFSMLDEIDSGLDVDSIYTVSDCIKKQNEEKNTGFLVISHYARLFNLIKPTRAAVIVNGRIVCEGGPELIDKIDKEGYKWIEEEYGVSIEKEEDKPMNKVSIGVCATKEIIKNGK